jgi:hypothetical protein
MEKRMPENRFKGGLVSWQTFEAVLEQYYDFCRRLRFFVKGGMANREEGMALEMIEDLLDRNEHQLDGLRDRGRADRESAVGGASEAGTIREAEERPTEKPGFEHEDQVVFRKLMEICRAGGYAWEYMKTVIDTTHADLAERGQIEAQSH